MHVFDVYHHPVYGDEVVRRGFSWSAFLVPSIWAVRRGLGWTTLLLVAASTMMFDVAELAGMLAGHPAVQIFVLLIMIAVVGIFPGFAGYRWHAAHLRQERFAHKCTIVASGRRQALRAANDDHFGEPIRVVIDGLGRPG